MHGVLRSALCDNAAITLGRACKRQPDWFEENESVLLENGRVLYDN